MNERVQQYLLLKQGEPKLKHIDIKIRQPEKWDAYKRDVLICAGLYDKVYSDVPDNDFCFYDCDPKTNTCRYYKQVPIEVTEEEFAAVREYSAIAYTE